MIAASRRGIELKRRRTNSVGTRRHSRWTSCQSSSVLRNRRRGTRCWTKRQKSSMGLRYGELPGHSKIEMPLSSRNARVEAAVCRSIILHENPMHSTCRKSRNQRARLLEVIQNLVLVCMSVEVAVDMLKTAASSPSDSPQTCTACFGALFKQAGLRRSSGRRVKKVDRRLLAFREIFL